MSTPSYDTVGDFLEDAGFRDWATGHRPQDRARWQAWLMQNPDKREHYEQAVALCLVLEGKRKAPTDEQVHQAIERMKRSFSDAQPLDRRERSLFQRTSFRWLMATTGVAALVVLGFFLRQPGAGPTHSAPASNQLAKAKDNWQEVTNSGASAQLVLLPDGSSVLLGRGGQLRYDVKFDRRRVYLQGDGFFEVVKDPARPFSVYTPMLTTRVLGTSFQVQASRQNPVAYVKVKTGKVSVQSLKDPTHPLVLVVNEQANLDTRTDRLVKQSINVPAQHKHSILAENLAFEFSPIVDILDKLGAMYHTDIAFDRKQLQRCSFTGNLNGVPFAEKIRLICMATEASYEIKGDKVSIQGHGCAP